MRKINSETDRKIQKKVEEFTLMDDFFFGFFFEGNPGALEDVISTCLGEEGLKVESVTCQYEIKNLHAHSLTMDAKAVLRDGRRIDVEVQRSHFEEIEPRSQFYLSALMFNSLERSRKYKDMDDVYVIFIMDRDHFGLGAEKYSTGDIILEPYCKMVTKGHLIFINGKTESDSAIGKLMNDFRCKNSENMQYNRLRERMEMLKNTEERMRLTESLREYFKKELDAGREDGIAEGLEKGREEEKSAIVQNMKNKGLTFETIAELTGIPLSKVQAL